MMRRPFALAKLLLVAALAVAVAGPALAFRQPDPTPLAGMEYRHPDLYIGNLYKHPSDLPSVAAGRAAADLQSLGVAADLSRIDRRTGRWGTLMMGEPLLPGYGNDLTWNGLGVAEPSSYAARQAAAWNAFYGWVQANQLALRINPQELRQSGHVTVHDDGGFIQIIAPRQIGGVPVRESYLTAVISGGNLILFGAVNWGDVGTSPIAGVGAEAARDRLLGHIAPNTPTGRLTPSLELIPLSRGGDDPALVSVGQGLDYRLAWVLRPRFANTLAEYEGLIDAHTGELIAFEDKANYGETTRSVIGGVYTVSNDGIFPDGIELVYPMPFADLATGEGGFFTDAGGNLASGGVPICIDGTITTELKGRYVSMTDDCGPILESTTGDLLNLGVSGGTDCTVPPGASAGNTHATRSGFYELNQMHAMGRGHIPMNAAVNGTLPANMNVAQTCNAMGGAGGVTFFRSGSGCSNTGELAGVFDHEWGHHMDALDANPGISSPGEGIADIYASLRLNTSCIGRNFRPGVPCTGYGDPCIDPPGPIAACTGVRDIDWEHRASGQPHDIAWIDANCGGGSSPCGGSVHCEGAVYAESVWDLWNRDLPAVYGMSIDQAREVAARLTFRGGQLVGTWYNCINGTGTGDGCNANGGYLNYLAADDDDANLANGTPHMEAIFDAFDRHDIACPTPTVQDSGCAGAPVAAPNVTVTGLDRATHLSWNAVAGASGYRIFRTQSDPLIFLDGFESGDTQQWPDGDFSCDFGKILVGETTDLSFIDTQGLLNGQEYHYMVFAMGTGDSCYGPASACRTSRPEAGPNLGVQPQIDNLDIQTGDADPFVDNCEVVEVSFNIASVGSGTQTNVRAVSVTSPSHPGIDGSITFPAQYAASLGPCANATGTFTFTASGLSTNDEVEFLVEVTSDELDAQLSGQVKTQTFAIQFTESDLQAQASLLFDFETDLDGWTVTDPPFTRMSGGGGDGTTWRLESSSALNNQCDRIRSPLMQFQGTSTLSLWNNYDIEPLSGGTWYDRANVALVGESGKVVVEPDGGRPYNAAPGGPGSYSGCNDGETGWADTNNTWGTSTWSAAEFGAVAPAGLSQIEVTYSTDAALAQVGFWFDEVEVTDVSVQVPDVQSDVCALAP